MTVLHFILDVFVGLVAGAAIGFGAALIAMSVDGSSRTDGTFGMREMIVALPAGAVIGVIVGAAWWFRNG